MGICRFWVKSGTCHWGDECWNIHSDESRDQFPAYGDENRSKESGYYYSNPRKFYPQNFENSQRNTNSYNGPGNNYYKHPETQNQNYGQTAYNVQRPSFHSRVWINPNSTTHPSNSIRPTFHPRHEGMFRPRQILPPSYHHQTFQGNLVPVPIGLSNRSNIQPKFEPTSVPHGLFNNLSRTVQNVPQLEPKPVPHGLFTKAPVGTVQTQDLTKTEAKPIPHGLFTKTFGEGMKTQTVPKTEAKQVPHGLFSKKPVEAPQTSNVSQPKPIPHGLFSKSQQSQPIEPSRPASVLSSSEWLEKIHLPTYSEISHLTDLEIKNFENPNFDEDIPCNPPPKELCF